MFYSGAPSTSVFSYRKKLLGSIFVITGHDKVNFIAMAGPSFLWDKHTQKKNINGIVHGKLLNCSLPDGECCASFVLRFLWEYKIEDPSVITNWKDDSIRIPFGLPEKGGFLFSHRFPPQPNLVGCVCKAKTLESRLAEYNKNVLIYDAFKESPMWEPGAVFGKSMNGLYVFSLYGIQWGGIAGNQYTGATAICLGAPSGTFNNTFSFINTGWVIEVEVNPNQIHRMQISLEKQILICLFLNFKVSYKVYIN